MWKFQKMPRKRIGANPIQGEFFCEDVVGKLVRETLQNSLDARIDRAGVPAEVVFSYFMGNKKYKELCECGMMFEGLQDHLKAQGSGISKVPNENEVVDFLLVEDFGTKGLNGKPDEWEELGPIIPADDGPSHDFYFFWRNVGRSGKTDQKLGSWGLGKQVFPAASRINTFFGYTFRSEDSMTLLMAQSVLKVHHTLSGKYEPYGYYANYQEDDFALPFHDSNHINAFLDVVPLRRMSGQAGLSVAIPFPSSELADKGPIVKAVVKEFFHPIIHGHLEVTIDYPGSDEIKITSETIKQYAYQFFGNDEALLESVELTLRSVCVNEENVLSLAINENRWRDVVLSTEQLEEMGVRLETDHFLALQVPAVVTHGGIEAKTFFSLYVSRCDSKFRSTCKYIREGIDVKDANNEKLDAGISALLEVHDGVLGGLLNRAENPAHTKWVIRGSGDRLHDYQEWRSVIAFVRNAPHEILKLILNRELEKHKDILSDIFYVEEDSDKPASIPTPRPPPKPTDDPPIAPDITDDKKKTKLIFTKKTGSSSGFSIKKNAAFSGSISKLTVKVAYRVSKGSPLKKYRSFDFCLDKKPIRVNADGFMNELYKSNVFVADVVSQKFILEIDGFDRQRDLYVYFDASVESVDDSET